MRKGSESHWSHFLNSCYFVLCLYCSALFKKDLFDQYTVNLLLVLGLFLHLKISWDEFSICQPFLLLPDFLFYDRSCVNKSGKAANSFHFCELGIKMVTAKSCPEAKLGLCSAWRMSAPSPPFPDPPQAGGSFLYGGMIQLNWREIFISTPKK